MAAALLLAAGVCAAGTAARAAETWATLQGDELAAAVSGRHMRLLSDGAVTQQFDAGGSFRAEWRDLAGGPRTAEGLWRVEPSAVCTRLPADSDWRCTGYARSSDGRRLRASGPDGLRVWRYDDF